MTYTVYILYSESLAKHYVGYATDVEARLARHLTNHSGYTAKAKDWELVWLVEVASKLEAIELERKIKKRGAARYLTDLNKSG